MLALILILALTHPCADCPALIPLNIDRCQACAITDTECEYWEHLASFSQP
jgi:hypothetical protein